MNARFRFVFAACALLVTGFVVSSCRSAYYAAWEKFGVEKRDILKERVVEARDGQQAASEQFKDALTRLREVYNFKGGDLEKAYDRLKSEFDASTSKADVVHQRIRSMETVAGDLFAEWESEIGRISTPAMASSSRQQLQETRARYGQMHSALKKAEAGMDPVLKQFEDYVLYLKHNLNAQAIASLKGEALSIQSDIGQLIDEMNVSISRADEFIKTLQ